MYLLYTARLLLLIRKTIACVKCNSVLVQVYSCGMPSFEAVDGSGIAVMSKVLATDPTPERSGDGGFGSIGDVLLKTSKATGVFRSVHLITKFCICSGL